MILFGILAVTIIFLITFLVFITGALGAGAIIIFGDVIVFLLIIGWIIKKKFF